MFVETEPRIVYKGTGCSKISYYIVVVTVKGRGGGKQCVTWTHSAGKLKKNNVCHSFRSLVSQRNVFNLLHLKVNIKTAKDVCIINLSDKLIVLFKSRMKVTANAYFLGP